MNRAVITFSILGTLACNVAIADEWIAGGASDNSEKLINISSIEKDGDVLGTWVIHISNSTDNGVAYELVWEEFNCKAKKMRYLDYFAYDFSGQNIKTDNGNGEWDRVLPGTVGEASFNAVCKEPQPEVIIADETPSDIADKVRKYRISTGDWK